MRKIKTAFFSIFGTFKKMFLPFSFCYQPSFFKKMYEKYNFEVFEMLKSNLRWKIYNFWNSRWWSKYGGHNIVEFFIRCSYCFETRLVGFLLGRWIRIWPKKFQKTCFKIVKIVYENFRNFTFAILTLPSWILKFIHL